MRLARSSELLVEDFHPFPCTLRNALVMVFELEMEGLAAGFWADFLT